MSQLRLTTALIAASLTTACLEMDDPEVGSTEQHGVYGQGVYGQGVYGQGVYGQGVYGQGVYGQGVSADGTGGFDGTINGSQFRASLKQLRSRLTNVRLEGSELRADLGGTTLTGDQLRWATWTSNGLYFRIAGVRHPTIETTTMKVSSLQSNATDWEYRIQWRANIRSDWQPVCPVGISGKFATLIPGSWNQRRDYVADDNITIGCSGGTIYKCTYVWGYKRWKRGMPPRTWVRAGVALAPLHSACVYAASASLCDSGVAHTKDGTLVDMIDKYGFNQESSQAELDELTDNGDIGDFRTESYYDTNGVVAVNWERYKAYFESTYPDGSSMPIYEPNEDDQLEYACSRPRFENTEPSSWLIKIRSDRNLWRDLEWDLPFDGTEILDELDPDGDLGGDRGGLP